MSGAIPTLPQYAFMAWCSVKAQGQLYLIFYPYHFTLPFFILTHELLAYCEWYTYVDRYTELETAR
jgi:hypothetical protein